MKKWVYLFTEGSGEMRDLLGGKGAGVAEMMRAGLPVPPGFTITTEACNAYSAHGKEFPEGMWDQAMGALKAVERDTGKRFGDSEHPLLVSVRSGARVSMPGMMETVLNLGLNDDSARGLARQTQGERFAYDAYRRFLQMFGRIVLDIDARKFEEKLDQKKREQGVKDDTGLDADALKAVVEEFKELIQAETGRPFASDPLQQLDLAIRAVFGSWNGKKAVDYREYYKIPHDLGTAVNVQTMVFGNMGWDSGTGVAFTRHPNTGEAVLYGEYLPNAQGEDVVAGIRTGQPIAALQQDMPQVYDEFLRYAGMLEQHYRDMQDLEFTIERSRLYMLQTRAGKRSPLASVKTAVDMVREGLISREEAIKRVEPGQVEQLLHKQIDWRSLGVHEPPRAPEEVERLLHQPMGGGDVEVVARGLNASPGAATGKAVLDADRAVAVASQGDAVILVRPETSPDDVHGIISAQGVLTARGGATSHAAVVTRGMGKPCVTGCEALGIDLEQRQVNVDGKVIQEGDIITIDGTTGGVLLGQVPLVDPGLSPELRELLSWADEARRLQVWANADYPRDAAKAREYGAEGIGLCRTEHMFFETERLPAVCTMILAAAEADARGKDREQSLAWPTYLESLRHIEAFQTDDFKGIFRAMDGLPVVIRLLDPPLHEFLAQYDKHLEQAREGADRGLVERLRRVAEQMHEANPMLGLRGCRLGVLYPEMYETQVRAIINAALAVAGEGKSVKPEIMLPLIMEVREFEVLRDRLALVAREAVAAAPVGLHYKFGTMIEVPRAALTADKIAAVAEFFSFGTNDLTQMTYGISRDDAEGKFLLRYVEQKLLPENPFQVLDRDGVGQLMRWAVEKGRAIRPDLELGICGEHGGDPASVAICHEIGLNYVSCSPFRVPVARLAAAQAALASGLVAQTVV